MLAAVVMLLAAAAPASARLQIFGPAGAAQISEAKIFDVGVTDFDSDGLLDLFTANHKFHPGLLRNDGSGNFIDVTAPTRFGPVPDYPGYEYLRRPSQMTAQGAYVFATDKRGEHQPAKVHVEVNGVEAAGSIAFGATDVTITGARNTEVVQGHTSSGKAIVYFRTGDAGGALEIQTQQIDLPTVFEFERPAGGGLPPPLGTQPPPPSIYVGPDAVPAPPQFVLNLRDRHGYAFADLAGDGAQDAFAIGGGLGGRIRLPGFRDSVQDEFLVQGGGQFADLSNGTGLSKGACRGRQVAATDINGDGQLDLFESCEDKIPNVYLQTSRGHFNPVTAPQTVATTYRFVTLGKGSRESLLAAKRGGIRVYTYARGGWRARPTISVNAHKGQVAQYALDDIDGDGDLDVLAVARSGNTLLENRGGKLHRASLRGTGIPKGSVAASFVDYDNDGRIDLDLVPQGLYRGIGKVRFRPTDRLRTRPAGAGITNWPDYDNDGLRDPVIATGRAEFTSRMKVVRARNLGPGGHWLEVNLIGHGGNREAIGARVTIRAGKRRMTGWVGESDDAHHSQGHYRIYFGLGRHAQLRSLVVRWPDGNKTRFGALDVDRVVTIAEP